MNKALRIAIILTVVILAVMMISPVAAQPTNSGKIFAPSGFGGNALDNQTISLVWKNVQPSMVVRIERAPLLSATSRPAWVEVGSSSVGASSYTDGHLKCSIAYQYRARTFDPATNSFSSYTKPIVVSTNACVITPQP